MYYAHTQLTTSSFLLRYVRVLLTVLRRPFSLGIRPDILPAPQVLSTMPSDQSSSVIAGAFARRLSTLASSTRRGEPTIFQCPSGTAPLFSCFADYFLLVTLTLPLLAVESLTQQFTVRGTPLTTTDSEPTSTPTFHCVLLRDAVWGGGSRLSFTFVQEGSTLRDNVSYPDKFRRSCIITARVYL